METLNFLNSNNNSLTKISLNDVCSLNEDEENMQKLTKINLSKEDSFLKVISSDRLNKDVQTLMNSTFWIEALKTSNAKGISDQLYFQLIESHNFVKEFIKYCVDLKRVFLNNLIKQNNDFKSQQSQSSQQQQQQQQLPNFDGLSIFSGCDSLFDDRHTSHTNLTFVQFSASNTTVLQKHEKFIQLPVQFLVECVYLSILDLNDYIGTSSEIISKIVEWFPEMRVASSQIKSVIESILNSTACFKRLMNYTRCSQQRKPIILGKRQYLWSINQNYLKPFIRYFYKTANKRQVSTTNKPEFLPDNDIQQQFISIPLSLNPTFKTTTANFNLNTQHFKSSHLTSSQPRIQLNECINYNLFQNLFDSWKSKLEQFKLLMQIKHNNYGFSWCDSIMLQKSNFNLNKLDFMSLGKTSPRHKEAKQSFKTDLNNNLIINHANKSKINKLTMQSQLSKKRPGKLIERKKSSISITKNGGSKSIDKNFTSVNNNIKDVHLKERQRVLINEPVPDLSKITVLDLNDLNKQQTLPPQPQQPQQHQIITETNLENFISHEEMAKLEENTKTINSIIGENFTSLVFNSTNTINSVGANQCSYFNLLPVSPSICHHYTTTNYFNQNEINVSNILNVSNVETSVEELFYDDLRVDNEISI